MWFIMDIATKWNDKALVQRCVEISLQILEYGWDNDYGGLFYFKDLKDIPAAIGVGSEAMVGTFGSDDLRVKKGIVLHRK